jgi:hypothetical protein
MEEIDALSVRVGKMAPVETYRYIVTTQKGDRVSLLADSVGFSIHSGMLIFEREGVAVAHFFSPDHYVREDVGGGI